ncbi:MAG: DoxX family membrane protein [Ignavibacteriae bacterium]|nr:DoxX family membrane protein [Ignavibacteriota bacterium]
MKKENVINYLIAITRIYLAVYFILSGLGKINNLDFFANSIENYKIFPTEIINILAIIIPWIEVISGALLLLGIYIRENSLIIASLLFVFTIAVISAVLRNLDIDCGCHGTIDGQKVGILKIIENISLFIVSILSIKFPKQELTFIKQPQFISK